MRLSAFASLIDFLTADRARVYAVLMMILGFSIAFSLWVATPERLKTSVDFPAFYNAGRIINEYRRGSLYDRELQQALYMEIAPTAAARTHLFFAYPPFFALFFAPLALLSYLPAFACWVLISLALFSAGFSFTWRASSLPVRHFKTGFVVALGFLPFYSWCLITGQTSAFGLFWLALAIYLDRKGRSFASGWALAMLLYKPTLLLLLVPMLMVTKRWRTFAGFCIGASMLGFVSAALIGPSSVPAYRDMLASFSHAKMTGLHLPFFDVDAFAFFLPFLGKHAWFAVLALAVVVMPFLIQAWRRDPDGSFWPRDYVDASVEFLRCNLRLYSDYFGGGADSWIAHEWAFPQRLPLVAPGAIPNTVGCEAIRGELRFSADDYCARRLRLLSIVGHSEQSPWYFNHGRSSGTGSVQPFV